MDAFITKGSHIRARWFKPKELGTWSLAGMQLKFVGDFVEVSGVVRHYRGDHPTNPTKSRFYIDADAPGLPTTRPPGCTCPNEHVEIDPQHVIGLVQK